MDDGVVIEAGMKRLDDWMGGRWFVLRLRSVGWGGRGWRREGREKEGRRKKLNDLSSGAVAAARTGALRENPFCRLTATIVVEK